LSTGRAAPRRAAPRRAALQPATPLLIDARSVKPTVVTFCPDNDSTGRNKLLLLLASSDTLNTKYV